MSKTVSCLFINDKGTPCCSCAITYTEDQQNSDFFCICKHLMRYHTEKIVNLAATGLKSNKVLILF